MLKKDFKIPFFDCVKGKRNHLLTLLTLLMCMVSMGSWAQSSSKPVESNLPNRRALVGDGCVVNKLITAVGVGSWVSNLENLLDEDLDNYATFPSIVSGTLGVNPIVSIRDMNHHYAQGTTAGFIINAGSGSSLLTLNIVNAFSIAFYKEGVLVGTEAVGEGQDAGGVGLSLITLPGSSEVNIELSTEAPAEFDEICLQPAGGVDLSAVTDTRIKYAFVGDLVKHTITESSMNESTYGYAATHGRLPFSLDQGVKQREEYQGVLPHETELGYWAGSDLINDDLTDGVAWGVLAIGAALDCRVGAAMNRQDTDQSQPFKAGSIVGFKYGNGSVLELPVGSSVKITLYKGEWTQKKDALNRTYYQYEQTEVQDETVSANILSLNLIKGGSQQVSIKAQADFSHARLTFPTGLTINVGGTKAYYAFVCDEPDVPHKCDIEATASTEICENETTFQLDAKADVTWSVVQAPQGTNVSIDNTGKATGLTENGTYVFCATSTTCPNTSNPCFQNVTVIRGIQGSEGVCDTPLFNASEPGGYELSTESHENGLVITALNNLEDPENILNPSFDDYASYTGGLQLLTARQILVGVKTTDGSLISDGSTKKRAGFVVEMKSTGLNLDAIHLFAIKTYRNGVETSSSAITESNLVSLNLIGSSKMEKMRFCVTVPEGVQFDEFVLCNNSVLSLDISRMNIYYSFVENADDPTLGNCYDPTGCAGSLASNELTGATINAAETKAVTTLSVAEVIDNLSFLIDNDFDTYTLVQKTVTAGNGTVIAVKLGRTYTPEQQIGLIIDDNTHLLNVDAGNWLTIKTYKNGVEKDSKNDWSVLGADVVGYGDKSILYIQPTADYDEIRITIAGVLNAAEGKRLYGLAIRNDADRDGVPDCRDENPCPIELVLDEEKTELNKRYDVYTNANLVLHRTFTQDKWNSLVLPVDLTWGQFRRAFGNEAMLAEPHGLNAQTPTLIEFLIKEHGDDAATAIEHGQFYIIHPQNTPDVTKGETYTPIDTEWDGTSVNGPIYFIKGVNYTKTVNQQPVDDQRFNHDPSVDHNDIIFKGTYVYLDGTTNQMIPALSYAFSGGDIYHIQNAMPMKGFRFWIEDTNPTGANSQTLSFGFSDTPTGIRVVDISGSQEEGNVFNLCGQEVSLGRGTNNLPKGIYIVNGKKIVIK